MSLFVGGISLAVTASVTSWLLLGPFGGRDALVAATPQLPPEVVDASLSAGHYGTTPTESWWFLALDAPHSTTPFDLFHTTGTSLALLGAMLLLSRVVRPVPLAAVGVMTLTLYVAHALLLASGVLPDDPSQSYLLQVVGALVIASAWWLTGRRGPLEAAVSAFSRA
nr:hypothetical protein [Micromonospora sp. DSM 115978]